uniref:igE-binding protein-like n=1 Tax=Arvicanthis niloticus TaxID=61156 RepID=UPI00402B7149
MGKQQIKPFFAVMQALLQESGLKIPGRALINFLKEVERVAPWFITTTGSLSKDTWDKLGADLISEKEKGKLRPRTWQIYKMNSQRIGRSTASREKEDTPKRDPHNKVKFSKLRIDSSYSSSSEETSSGGGGGEEEDTSLTSSLEGSSPEPFNSEEQRELEKEVAHYESERYGRDPPYAPEYIPSAPPIKEVAKIKKRGSKEKLKKISLNSLITAKEIKRIRAAFPVWEDANQARHHSPLDLKQLKTLAESVQTYGVNASFTQALIDRLTANAMTPEDWYNTVKACLTMGQYLDWKSIFHEHCTLQARQNTIQGHPQWNFDMLTGQGQWTVNQTAYPIEVYEQINKAAVKAWKSLPNKGQVTGNLTKIIQGGNEPFSDFVARMIEAAGRVFGDPETAMPLIEQLIFEQCTRECRNAITPWKGKGLNAWMKACREIGGPLSNAGLAAAVLTVQRASNIKCFKCGRMGHIQRQCRASNPSGQASPKQPGMCSRCNKGKHWVNECRSVKDYKGRPFTFQPKNGQLGPRPQGP